MIGENRHARAHVDIPLLILVFGMALFGVVAVCVATYTTDSNSEATFLQHVVSSSYTMRQCLFLMMAPLVVGVLMALPYEWLRRQINLIYYLTVLLLVVVTVTNRATGVKAWLDVLWNFTIQPSEFAKLTLILVLAKRLSRSDKPLDSLKEKLTVFMLVGIPGLVILLQGETGSLMVIIFLFGVMMFFANVDWKFLGLLVLGGFLALLALYGIMVATGSDDYRLARIAAFIDPEMYSSSDAYQMRQSQMAIGSGGLTGIGMFKDGAISQLNYVPADWTDFIYATIGETWGFVGCLSVLTIYVLIIIRMLYLAWFTRDKYGRLIICGVMGMLLFHVLENIAMTLGLMPITGIPLPFLSYGGSNMVTNMGGVGLVLNVTRNRKLSYSINTPQTLHNPYRISTQFKTASRRY